LSSIFTVFVVLFYFSKIRQIPIKIINTKNYREIARESLKLQELTKIIITKCQENNKKYKQIQIIIN